MSPDRDAEANEALTRHRIDGWLRESGATPESAALADPNHRWRATSAWQKAIRRGDPDTAVVMVSALWAHDPRYVLYRLPIILMEDIGWGDPALLLSGLHACGRPILAGVPDRFGLVLMLTERAARATKDRTSCDLVVGADRRSLRTPAPLGEPTSRTVRDLGDALRDEQGTPFERMTALWRLAGTVRYPGDHIVVSSGLAPEAFDEVLEEFPSEARAVFRIARARMRSAMPLAALLTHRYVVGAQTTWEETVAIPSDPDIGGYPASSFDWNTREGRRSIGEFLKACDPWREWLARAGVGRADQRRLTADFLMSVEGELVDRRLRYEPWSGAILDAPLAIMAGWHGIDAEAVGSGKALLRQHLPVLHDARRRVVD